MNDVLGRWNSLNLERAAEAILPCCGSEAWARELAARRPIRDEKALLAVSDDVWKGLSEWDWLEAFRSHPRIGESRSEANTGRSEAWSKEEQQEAGAATEDIRQALAKGNCLYEQRFQRTFIVCATGKSGEEILEILRRRLRNDDQTELLEAAEQQRRITQLRLKKWLAP